jgi:hypothetical protein
MLYQQIVDATGGPHTLWAKHVKAAARDEADPLRQRHRSAMRQRTEDRDRQLVEILRTQPQRTVARDREVAKLFDDHKLETFVTWAAREKHRLDAEWEARAQVAKSKPAAGRSIVEQLRADARAVDESIRRDKITAAEATQRELHALNLAIARAACVPIAGTKAAEYLAGRGLRVGNAALFSANWPQGVANDAGEVTKGFGPAVVFDWFCRVKEVLAKTVF